MATPFKRANPDPNKFNLPKNKSHVEEGGTFQLLVGDYLTDGPPGCECDDCLKTPEDVRKANGGRGKNHRYRQRYVNRIKVGNVWHEPDPEGYDNDIIESSIDLTKFNPIDRLGKLIGEPKFARIQPGQYFQPAPRVVEDDGLETLSVKELRALAEQEELEIGSNMSKTQLIDVLRQHYGAAETSTAS